YRAAPGVQGGAGGVVLPVERHRAAIRAQRTGQDVHEGALPCPVLPDQGMHLSRPDYQVYPVQRDGGTETLAHTPKVQCGGGRVAPRARSIAALHRAAQSSLRYRSTGGRISACDSGVPMLSGVIMLTPVSMRSSTVRPCRCSTIVFTPR